MSRLALFLLGSPRIECDGEPVQIRRRKVTALLVYLAVTGRRHSRDALATLFWPEHDQSQARAGLRRTLASLKRSLGGDWLDIDRESVGLAPSADRWLDVDEFRGRVDECGTHGHARDQVCPTCLSVLADAVALYGDDFLSGFTLSGSPGFDEWQFFQTESLRQELAGALERLVRGHAVQGTYDVAIPYARRWLALDPLHEPVHQHLMKLYAWSGQHAAALRQYRTCRRVLEEELGVSPEEETARLSEAIQERQELPPPRSGLAESTAPPPVVLDDRYRLEGELGRGGTGIVYRAHDALLDRQVAVKVLSAASLGTKGRARLLEEAQAAAKLNHPNIVSVYDAGEVEGASFIVTELVQGDALHTHHLKDLQDILAVAQQISAALEHAHEHGIVHRDLKPENVILASDGTVKLTDFGLARPVASRVTSEGRLVGTVFYLAPELALGQTFDGRADLYALGVMLYEWTARRLPFSADDPVAVISQHLHAPVVPPRARNPDIPPGLDALIVRLLSKNPQDRPGSATEVLQALRAPDILDPKAVPEEPAVLHRIGRGRLVGREREMQIVRALWSRVLSDRGQLLLISGEAGIGKTRLVRELVTQARVTGGRVWVGASYAEGGVPYAPFAQILHRSFEEGLGDLEVPAFVLAGLITLAPALRLRYPDIPAESTRDDPLAEQQRLFEALVLYLTALSERTPLLLVLEDIHWADSGTLSLLRHVARRTRHGRVMIAATHRDVGWDDGRLLHETLLDLSREGLAHPLRLPRLDREQTGEMLAALFAAEVTSELVDGIYRQTEGNPFYTEEVCKALVESGKLTFRDGRWHRPRIAELGIPQSIRVAILSRVGALPAHARETLRLAAVLGRAFDFETLAEASAASPDSPAPPVSESQGARAWGRSARSTGPQVLARQAQDEEMLIEGLEHAERAQLIEELSRERGGTFSFVHALIPSTLMDSTRSLQRRRLHRQAAAGIRALRPDDLEALAYHYRQAGQAEQATHYLLQAGDRARGLYAHQEAIHSYRQALDLLQKTGGLERAARTLMKLGLTYHSAFDFQAARQAYQEGFVLWRRAGEAQTPQTERLPPAPHALRVTALEPSSLSPGVGMDLPSAVFQEQLFSGLVEVSPDMSVVPGVARTWDVLAGGRKYVFHLRDDVYWSDGAPVTAGDFEYALKQALEPSRQWKAVQLLFDIRGARAYHRGEVSDPNQVGVRALDERTLAIELEGPTSYFPYLPAFPPMFPVPRHVVQAYGPAWEDAARIVTNGPFRVVEWEQGEFMVLERNPTYHGRFTGNLQRVECRFLSSQPARLLRMYAQDQLDICTDLPPAEWARARQQYASEYVSGPRLSVDFIGLDVRRPPFDDRRVRQALTMATDREALADVTLSGYAFPATGGFVPPGMPGHSPGIGLPYDPERARRLLAEAGYPSGRGFPAIDCIARDDPGHDLLCAYLQAQWRESLGIEIAWEEIAWARFPDRMSEAIPHVWMVGYWADYPDPDDYLRVMWWLPPGWQHPTYDRLVEDARRTMDQAQRTKLYQRADTILAEEAPILPLCYARVHMLVKPRVRRYLTSPLRWWYWKDVILEPS